MENLTRISENTPIKGFETIYNENNEKIINIIIQLQNELDALKTEYNDFKSTCQSKFVSLETEIKNSLPQFNEEIEKRFTEIYNIIYK